MTVSHSPRIDKALFAAGQQCAKRLYLEFHQPESIPEAPLTRQFLQEVGHRVLELACQGFPKVVEVDDEDIDAAAEATSKLIKEGDGAALFNAAFVTDYAQVRCDIVLPTRDGKLDLFEVKAGTKIKPRHIMDVGLQIHVVESYGHKVNSASVLHLNPAYLHDGGKDYPAHSIFCNVDVTKKARKRARKVQDLLHNYQSLLGDESTAELPTGTWCLAPIPCTFLDRCRGEAAEQPLIDLPDLNQTQEFELHQEGIEDLSQIDAKRPGLTLTQRRALRAVSSGELVVESVAGDELRDVEHPLCLVTADFCLQVLPVFAKSRPWQHLPFQWNALIVNEKGETEYLSWQSDGKEDPRPAFVSSLAQVVAKSGCLVLASPRLDHVLRHMIEDLPDTKADCKAVLNHPALELDQVVETGVYHPAFRGNFELNNIIHAIAETDFSDLEIGDPDAASAAYQKLLVPRTRATTRQKTVGLLDSYGRRRVEGMLTVYRALLAD